MSQQSITGASRTPTTGVMRNARGSRRYGAHCARRAGGVAWVMSMAVIIGIGVAPRSVADASANMQSAVASARSGCPALQPNPVLNELAQRANLSTDSYILFRARSQPIGSPKGDVLPALHQMGYSANKAKILSGYGDPEITGYGDVAAKAIYGAILEGYEAIPDCGYTRLGTDVLQNESKGYALATVILTDG